MAQYLVILTIKTDDLMPGARPDVCIGTQCGVSIIPDDPTAEEIFGRVISIEYERVDE